MESCQDFECIKTCIYYGLPIQHGNSRFCLSWPPFIRTFVFHIRTTVFTYLSLCPHFLGYPTLPIFSDLVQMTLITYVSPDKCLIDQHLSHKGWRVLHEDVVYFLSINIAPKPRLNKIRAFISTISYCPFHPKRSDQGDSLLSLYYRPSYTWADPSG